MRSEYWWFLLFTFFLSMGANLIDEFIIGLRWGSGTTPLALAADMLTVFPMAAVTTRRLHDIGMSGWWQAPVFVVYILHLDIFIPAFLDPTFRGLVVLIAAIYGFWLLIRLARDSDPYINQYGPNPKGEDMADVFT